MRMTRFVLLVIGCAGPLLATAAPVPEIDANTGMAALTMISGGLLILRSRRRK